MISICMYFQVHQPNRLRNYSFFNIGEGEYFDDEINRRILKKVAENCYLPTTRLLLFLIQRYGEYFQFSFSLTGTFIEQLRKWEPEVLDQFKRLADTGHVEFLAETYYHSLASLYSEAEFKEQVRKHVATIKREFGLTPSAFRNTELIYNNRIAQVVSDMGYIAVLLEGADRLLGWRSPNYVSVPRNNPELKCFMRNYRLSDDIAFRFSAKEWVEYPLTADKFARWIYKISNMGDVVNLFMDFETFGEHQWKDTGIFNFLQTLPGIIQEYGNFYFRTISATARKLTAFGFVDTEKTLSWADLDRDASAWIGNSMQQEALDAVYELEGIVKEKGDPEILDIWRKLQTSDHFYYMSTKYLSDGAVHRYFNPYRSPHEAYIFFMNVLQDFRQKLE